MVGTDGLAAPKEEEVFPTFNQKKIIMPAPSYAFLRAAGKVQVCDILFSLVVARLLASYVSASRDLLVCPRFSV